MSAARTHAPSGARRARGARESLGAIVLGFEIIVIFLGALVAFGLHVLSPAVALLGGGGVIVLMIIAIALLRYQVGVWLGWAVQLIAIASGFLVGMMFVVGGIFTALWLYCMVMGTKLDRAARARPHPAQEKPDTDPPGAAGAPGTDETENPQ